MDRHVIPEAIDLKPGETTSVTIKGRAIVLANVGGKLYATSAVCAHQGGPVDRGRLFDDFQARVDSSGKVEEYLASKGTVIACPWHGWEYDIRTGRCLWNSDFALATYRVERNDQGEISIYV
jgi:nitrite reductase (NADH) small subunit